MHMHFYGNMATWKWFGKRLIAFSQTTKDYVLFDTPSYAAQLTLKSYCYDPLGHAAIQVVFHINEAHPYRCRLDFSLPAEVASINKLGQLLSGWQISDGSQIIWQAVTS